uniref:Uncharacterized protein n=1 Tax=Panagrolaimus sp. ES5 TaxID=591445 RepID=A0AC34GF43_9BILA
MANLLIATRENQHRYAYGLTVDCTFFFFEMSKYNTFELALDYHQSQHDRGIQTTFCPADMFNVRYVPQNYTPYFEVLELKAGVSHYIPMTNKSLFFTHVTPRSQGITKDWKFSPSGWATHYLYLLIHAKPHINQRTGKSEVRTYIRH